MTRGCSVLTLLLSLAAVSHANADYPDRPVRVVVPVAAGGGVDVMARLLAQKLGERLGSNSWSRTAPAPPASSAARR